MCEELLSAESCADAAMLSHETDKLMNEFVRGNSTNKVLLDADLDFFI